VKRLTIITVVVAGLLALNSLAASADGVNGQGQTPLSASLGFNAQDDLSGELNYNADPNGPNAGFSAHCSGYRKFALTHNIEGYPRVSVSAICTDQDNVTVYLVASFIDKGEPGTNDWICVGWSYKIPPKQNLYIHDMGTILNGNIQIHEDGSVEMLSTP
jgi:hypothetical protein